MGSCGHINSCSFLELFGCKIAYVTHMPSEFVFSHRGRSRTRGSLVARQPRPKLELRYLPILTELKQRLWLNNKAGGQCIALPYGYLLPSSGMCKLRQGTFRSGRLSCHQSYVAIFTSPISFKTSSICLIVFTIAGWFLRIKVHGPVAEDRTILVGATAHLFFTVAAAGSDSRGARRQPISSILISCFNESDALWRRLAPIWLCSAVLAKNCQGELHAAGKRKAIQGRSEQQCQRPARPLKRKWLIG
jgi:hypothetical protein